MSDLEKGVIENFTYWFPSIKYDELSDIDQVYIDRYIERIESVQIGFRRKLVLIKRFISKLINRSIDRNLQDTSDIKQIQD